MAQENPFAKYAQPQPQLGGTLINDPSKSRAQARADEQLRLSQVSSDRATDAANRATNVAEVSEGRNSKNDRFTHLTRLAGDYNSDPGVKTYRVAISQLGQALTTGEGPQADLALTYAFAKAMDPESVVRDSEQSMVIGSQPWFQSAVEAAKKQFGMDGAGNFTPQAREALRRQIANSVTQRVKVYDARRGYYEKQANALGVEPDLVVGEHDAAPFVPTLKAWGESRKAAADKSAAKAVLGAGSKYLSEPPPVEVDIVGGGVGGPNPSPSAEGYDDSYVSQGLSGVNKGVANVLGAPVDLLTGALNLGTSGINALANTGIPSIDNPLGGSQSIKNGMRWLGSIGNDSKDPSKQFVNRVGESVGSAMPFAGTMGTLARGGSALATAAGGGVGAATAQQLFPGNPYAEMAGEVVGSGGTGLGFLNAGRRNSQRIIDAAIPTSDQLRAKAGDLYRQAESRGVVAGGPETQALADTIRQSLVKEGQISPSGATTGAYPTVAHAQRMADEYAGQPINPTQIQSVRKSATSARNSMDAEESRLGSILTGAIDDWAAPIAPELASARNVASRYLTAEPLERARQLAHANNSKFTASGLENALRQEYRGLDRSAIRGSQRFTDDVTDAIETVNRGTPMSNIARGFGKLAPTGLVSGFLPTIAASGLSGSPFAGGALGATAAGVGMLGRYAATKGGLRAAEVAELTARNGGAIPQAPLMTPETERMIRWLAASQATNHLPQ